MNTCPGLYSKPSLRRIIGGTGTAEDRQELEQLIAELLVGDRDGAEILLTNREDWQCASR